MNRYSLFHLADGPRTALQIAHIAEFDARRLYAPQGYASMFDYCVAQAHLSDDAALKRIRAARAARAHPVLFEALAEGRLHLTAVVLLAPHLTEANVDELIVAATHRSVAEIKALLARRFPQPDQPLAVAALAPGAEVVSKSPDAEVVSKPVAPAPRPRVAPLAPERYGVQFTMGQATHEALRYLEQLLDRRLTAEDMDQALEQGFKAMAAALEKRKFAATDKPRKPRRPARGRHIPAEVKRTVWQRDQGRCTFLAESGRCCEARSHLEFDHIEPVARGGRARVENLRLRCRAHNQYAAERAFGAGFMHEQRQRARRAAARQRAPVESVAMRRSRPGGDTGCGDLPTAGLMRPDAATSATAAELDVTPWLRQLGFRAEEARRAAAHCESIPDAPLEQRIRAALTFLAPPARVHGPHALGATSRS
jgi:5-methylcytosine-specific restriction endonuclease McrA